MSKKNTVYFIGTVVEDMNVDANDEYLEKLNNQISFSNVANKEKINSKTGRTDHDLYPVLKSLREKMGLIYDKVSGGSCPNTSKALQIILEAQGKKVETKQIVTAKGFSEIAVTEDGAKILATHRPENSGFEITQEEFKGIQENAAAVFVPYSVMNDKNYFEKIEPTLKMAKENGIKTVITLHGSKTNPETLSRITEYADFIVGDLEEVAANYQGSDLLENFTSKENKFLVTTKGAEGVEIRGDQDKTDIGIDAAKVNLEGKLNPVGVGNTYEAAVLQIAMMENPNEKDMGKVMRFGVCAAAVKALKEGVPYLTKDDAAKIQDKHKEYMQDERVDAYSKERSERRK